MAQVLRHMDQPESSDTRVLLGLDAPDDAGVYRIDDEVALVQTVDFFTPVVDVPYDWGAIAAANAVSDVYAMGGRPITALNLVAWPSELDLAWLGEVLQGAADKASEAGLSIVGGHSIQDDEPKFGMAVTGIVHPERFVAASAARPGMALLLTKPLGSGIAATAIKRSLASPDLVESATSTMAELNKAAAEVLASMRSQDIPLAATDVTGFGLMGHLLNMLKLSGVGASISATSVPRLEGVDELARQGVFPDGSDRNREHYGPSVAFEEAIDPALRMVLFDAQTSGGLLIAVDAGSADRMMNMLQESGVTACVIGSVVPGEPRIEVAA